MLEEILDLVDKNDNVIGAASRKEIYQQDLNNYRVINGFIKNENNELWIPRRTANKAIFPLCLDMSVGGHVETGESYEDGLRREIMEELNIDLDKVQYKEVSYLTPHNSNVSSFMKVYEIYLEEAPVYNEEDFTEYYWLKPEEVLEKIEKGDKTKGDLPKLIEMIYVSHN